jgi:hypothetical protein
MTLIHKSVSPFGDWIIFMDGVPLYKKWPTGRSLVFEKYGLPTSDSDRDNGHYGGTRQRNKETSAVETNPFKFSTETLATMISGLLEGTDEHVARATRLFTVAIDALYWKRDAGITDFNFAELRDHLNLKTLIDLNDPSKHPTMPVEVRSLIREYLYSIPGFRPEMGDKQPQETFDSHAQSEMAMTKLFGSLAEKYSYLFDLPDPLRVADAVYGEGGGISPVWQSYLLGDQAPSGEGVASETAEVLMEAYEGLPEDMIGLATRFALSPEVARALHAERQRWQAENERLRKAADYISPYLRYTVGDESPGHHPTMPSAVAAFHVAFDIDTPEKRMARARLSLTGIKD